MSPSAKQVVVFDGVCNLCNAAVQFILDHDRRRRFFLTSSQSEAGRRLLAATPLESGEAIKMVESGQSGASPGDTIFLIEGGRAYDRSTAALRIARGLGFPWSLLYGFIVVPRFLRDFVYKFVARNRYRWFGRRETCRVARPSELERFLE